MQSKAILFRDVNVVTVEEITIPEPGPGEVLIETAFSVMSPGTELRCLAGQQPNAAPWPAIPGYSLSGTIVAAGPGATLPIGTRVFATGTRRADGVNLMWGGHVAHAVVPQQAVFAVPDALDLRDAAAAHLIAIAYHGLRLAQPLPHERIAVLGLGAIGQLAALTQQLSQTGFEPGAVAAVLHRHQQSGDLLVAGHPALQGVQRRQHRVVLIVAHRGLPF